MARSHVALSVIGSFCWRRPRCHSAALAGRRRRNAAESIRGKTLPRSKLPQILRQHAAWVKDDGPNHYLDDPKDMRDQIAFAETWNLQGYRRTTEGPDIYLVKAKNGTLIDAHGYLRGMLSHVSLPFRFEYDHPVRFASDVGETWNLYVHKLNDGLVILGVRVEITPERVDELFVSNAARFGASVADALRTPERAIHEAFDYSVVDKNGILLWAI